ncbi:HVO_2072 family ArtA-dependent S-layer glycoprotein [Natrinema sp. J7-2]|uniref:HVO_2072 family ArtA-dependent S-layer glycoprotein n=1 Tax=Natrinema sp. (strain J7-2) TaxID=406552 RepID=UPI00026D52F4|nr:HVO_2072 family ArtA-dependent S-layer glycoprotein [Natrinema sp. J7-2]AFO56772.1 Cell surface glycoprotein [Natrinema sp. J7-2]
MTTDNITYREKGRAVLLTAMMVLSVVAMSAAFVGGAAAAENTDEARYYSNEPVTDGDTIYQGEDDFKFGGNFSTQTLNRIQDGSAQGEVLQVPVRQDQQTGRYGDGNGNRVNVVTPRVSEIEINRGDTDVSDSSVSTEDADNLEVVVDFNFDNAEYVDLTVESEEGTDITNAVLDDSTIETDGGNTTLDLADEDAGEYTITAEGSENLDFGDAVKTTTVELTSDSELGLDIDSDSAVRGDDVKYTVTGGSDEQTHLVVIESSDFRDGYTVENAEKVFRNVEDTNKVGAYPADADADNIEFAWAEVEMDGTSAVGQIETQYLDESSIDVEVYENDVSPSDVDSNDPKDDTSVEVTEGEISVENPDGTYVVGSEIDINGTATSSDEVAIFARDNGDWELIEQNIDVESDDTFEEEDYVLSRDGGAGSKILSLPGTYRFGVVDQAHVSDVMDEEDTIGTSDFNKGTSTSTSLRVVKGNLSAQFTTIDGQISENVDGDIDVSGTASGQNEVVLAFVDERGNTVATTTTVDSDDNTFEEEDFSLGDLSQGTVSAHVISSGRDDQYGDDELTISGDDTEYALNEWITQLGESSLSGDQIRDRITAQTVDETASDDAMVTDSFRYTDASTTIDSIYPKGAEADGVNPVAVDGTIVVEGSTNLQPDENTITVEVKDKNDETKEVESTDKWGTNGNWTLEVPTENIEDVGSYTVESDDGETTDRAEIEVVEEINDSDENKGNSDENKGDSDENKGDSDDNKDDSDDNKDNSDENKDNSDDNKDDSDSSDSSDSSDDSTPGFGVGVALVALLGAALVALRRDN